MIRWLATGEALAGFYTGAADFPHCVRSILEDEAPRVGVMALTILDLARLTAEARLPPLIGPDDASLTAMLRAQGFQLLALDAETAEQAANLPQPPANLTTRTLTATAQRTGTVVLTSDAAISGAGVPCLWAEG